MRIPLSFVFDNYIDELYSTAAKRSICMQRYFRALIPNLLILLFGYTAISKLFHYRAFRATLRQVPLIEPGAALIAVLLPLCELALVLLLAVPALRRRGMKLSLALLLIMTLYLIYMVLFTPHLPCSCGGVISRMGWTGHIFFNLGWIGLTYAWLRVDQRVEAICLNT
jgi:hypothetical protein